MSIREISAKVTHTIVLVVVLALSFGLVSMLLRPSHGPSVSADQRAIFKPVVETIDAGAEFGTASCTVASSAVSDLEKEVDCATALPRPCTQAAVDEKFEVFLDAWEKGHPGRQITAHGELFEAFKTEADGSGAVVMRAESDQCKNPSGNMFFTFSHMPALAKKGT